MKIVNSITFKFAVGLFIIVTVVTVLLGLTGYSNEKRAIEDRLYAQLNAIADLKKQLVVRYLNERKNDLRIIAPSRSVRNSLSTLLDRSSSPAAKRAAAGALQRRLGIFERVYPGYLQIEITGLDGRLLASSGDPDMRAVSHEAGGLLDPYAENLRRDVPFIIQHGLGSGHLDVVMGVRDDGGVVRAAAVASISLDRTLFPLFTDYTGLGRTGETLLLRRTGGLVSYIGPTRYPPLAVDGYAVYGDEYQKLAALATSGNEGIDYGIDHRGKEVIGAYRYIPSLGWGLVTKIDTDEAFAEIAALRQRTTLFALAVLAVMLGVAYVVGRELTSPVAKLIRNTKAITAGHFSTLEKSGRTDEIGELEENFNEMVVALEAARRQAGIKYSDLENKVKERTDNLARTNAALSGALAEIRRESDEKKALQAQLLHAQKMEAVGTLAGGIAHDFNNILTAIIGYCSVMRMKLADDDPHREYLDHILSAAERAAHLTHSLLAFSRKQIINPQPVNLNEIIKRVQKLLARLMGEDIELRIALCEPDPVIMADSGQIEQVLMNLATNARDAMESGGRFSITTETAGIDADFIDAHGYGREGSFAVIEVADTGSGMDEVTQARIFEPFFTTKDTGRGTGLGLSIVYGIVKQQNGFISCSSKPGGGTRFRIYLPVTHAAAEERDAAEARRPVGGRETILVAEDSDEVRELTRAILSEFGYRIIEAVDGVDAVKKFAAHRDEIDLLLLDIIMPRKNGKAALEEIRTLRPDIRVVFTSGYTADIIRQRGFMEEDDALLTKPLSPQTLLTKIREVLDGSHGT